MCSAGAGRYWLVLVKVYVQASSQTLHMVSFEIFVKSMPPSLSELKVIPSFCFLFKIPDDPTASNIQIYNVLSNRNALTISNIFGSSESCLITLFSISIFYHENDFISFDYKQANKIRVSFHVTKFFRLVKNRYIL